VQRSADDQRVTTGNALRMSDVRGTLPRLAGGDRRQSRFAPSAERSMQDRERRHRERAIAAWLRDLSR